MLCLCPVRKSLKDLAKLEKLKLKLIPSLTVLWPVEISQLNSISCCLISPQIIQNHTKHTS